METNILQNSKNQKEVNHNRKDELSISASHESNLVKTKSKAQELMPNENATQIVRWLFGDWIGPVVGDYSCSLGSYYSGRLYAGYNAICFYSNLFGFERKLSMKYMDITELSLYRTTSIIIKTKISSNNETDSNIEEEYIFRSFVDRDHVYSLLLLLRHKDLKRHTRKKTANDKEKKENNSSFNILNYLSSSFTSPVKEEKEEIQDIDEKKEELQKNLENEKESELVSSKGRNEENDQVKSYNTLQEFNSCFEKDYKDVGIKDLSLNYNLETYYNNFINDEAPYSLPHYHSTIIHDTDVTTTTWNVITETTKSRTIQFIHSMDVPIGASSTRCTKYQKVQKYKSDLILYTTTVLYDCHNADCFQVQDIHWIHEKEHEQQEKICEVMINVRFQVVFLKYTMFHHLIEKMTRKAFLEGIALYQSMLISSLNQNTNNTTTTTIESSSSSSSKNNSNDFQNMNSTTIKLNSYSLMLIGSFLAVIVIFLVGFGFLFLRRIRTLSDRLDIIQEQNLFLLDKIQLLIQDDYAKNQGCLT